MIPHPVQEMPCQKWLSIKEIYVSVQFIGIHSQIALFQMLMLDVHVSKTDTFFLVCPASEGEDFWVGPKAAS